MNRYVSGSRVENAINDELAATIDKNLRSAIKANGRDDEWMFYHLRARVARDDSGEIVIHLSHPSESLRKAEDGGNRTDSWLLQRAEWHPLAQGLALWFSPENPEIEIAARQHVIAEERRRAAALNAEREIEERAKRAEIAAAASARAEAWSRLPAEEQARIYQTSKHVDVGPPQNWEGK